MWHEDWRGRKVWSTEFSGERTVIGLAPEDRIYVVDETGVLQVELKRLWDAKTNWPLYMYSEQRRHRRGGRLRYEKWYVYELGDQDFQATRIIDGKSETKNLHSHCLACAKTDVLAKYGGEVDLRGWQRQGTCGVFLYMMAIDVKKEGSHADDD